MSRERRKCIRSVKKGMRISLDRIDSMIVDINRNSSKYSTKEKTKDLL